jgi:hypothetical protein
MHQWRRKKQEGPSLQAATGIAAVAGGTGLFAAALALQRRPVRVHVPQTDLNDTDREVAGSTQCRFHRNEHRGDIKKRIGDKNDGRLSMMDIDALIRTTVDDSIRALGDGFTVAGKKYTHGNIRVDFMQPENKWMLKSSNGDYSELKDYINRTVKLFSTTKDIFDLK